MFRDLYAYRCPLSGGARYIQAAAGHFPDAVPGILNAQMPLAVVNSAADIKPDAVVRHSDIVNPSVSKLRMLFAQSRNHGQRVVNERGYTLLCDCQQAESPYKVLSEMARNGEFTVRVSGVHNVNDATREADLEKRGSARAGPLSCY